MMHCDVMRFQELFHLHSVEPGKAVNGEPIVYSRQEYDEAWKQNW